MKNRIDLYFIRQKMSLKQTFNKHKDAALIAIVGAIVGASLGSLTTQHFTTQNLTRSFKHQENVEILNSTQKGIGFLKQVEGELDNNSALIINHDYGINVDFGEPVNLTEDLRNFLASPTNTPTATNAAPQATIDAFSKYQNDLMGGTVFRVKNVVAPVELLSTTVWDHGVPEVADIDADLLNELSHYYMLVTRMNYAIKAFASDINAGQMVPPERAGHVRKMIDAYNEDFSTLKKEDIIGLKDKIGKEVARLSNLRSQIEANEASNR